MVDRERASVAQLEESLDVQTFVGNACDPTILHQLEIQKTDLLIACTEKDETNLICCFTAKRLGCSRVISRVRSRFFFENSEVNYQRHFGIDRLVSPEILTAHELAQFVATPQALAVVTLARGAIQLRTLRLSPKSDFAGKRVQDIKIPNGSLIAGVRRNDDVSIVHGNTILEPDDRVTLIGLPEVLEKASPLFTLETVSNKTTTVTIAGGGETGLALAEILEKRGQRVIILEKNRERAEFIGERLEHTRVLHADATEIHTLREERIENSDYYLAVMGDDENNVMSAVLAKEIGVGKTACLIDRPDYARIVEKIGVDIAISPRIVMANRVMTMVKRGRIRSVTLLEEGALEINEYQALSQSKVVGQPLKDIPALKGGVLVGAIHQSDGQVVIPRGDHVIKPGDIVILVATPAAAEKLDDLFAATTETQS